ncbi:MAG: hypothetical protein JSV99_06190 [Planctomycetota bacterium]|nr:MAG: hypothetical protein JSV99_06190 [Planctomycetota bacterium]
MRKWVILMVLAVLGAPVQGETVYFLVGEKVPFHNDCYVLPLDYPFFIDYARELIEYGTGEYGTIVVATIYRWEGEGMNINRNYLKPGLAAWSWAVIFDGFAEVTVEICDGWPGWLEDEPGGWPTGSQICFWDYTVVAELGTNLEPWFCNLDADDDVDFDDFAMFAEQWGQSGCGHRYWCDGADLDGSGTVDGKDLAMFAENWLWGN